MTSSVMLYIIVHLLVNGIGVLLQGHDERLHTQIALGILEICV